MRSRARHRRRTRTAVGLALAAYLGLSAVGGIKASGRFPVLKGPYLGQSLPGDAPVPFAPGVVSCGLSTRDIAWMPDGSELYFSVSAFRFNLVFETRLSGGVWTEPKPASFSRDARYLTYEPHITPDGKRLLFLSDRPTAEGGERNQNIWAVDRRGDGWGEPYVLGATISTEHAEYFPSTTRDGTLYFTRMLKGERTNGIYRARRQGDGYGEAEKLPAAVQIGTDRFNVLVDPDERFIIVPASGMPDSIGGTDYYIVFRNSRDEWSKPVNLGPLVNTTGDREFSPALSPDGKYFFFMTTRPDPGTADRLARGAYVELQEALLLPGSGNATVYWVSAAFLNRLRPEGF